MTEIVSPSVWYPYGYPGPSFDLNTILCWTTDWQDPAQVAVTFVLSEPTVVRFNKVNFDAAVAAYSIQAADSMRTAALWTVGASTYNLEKVLTWSVAPDPTQVNIRFSGADAIVLTADLALFEAAYQAYQDAVAP